MNLTELRERIARWEDLHTEFKEAPISAHDSVAAIVAFANTDGGQLVFGVTEGRQIVGIADPDALARQIDNYAVNNCEPPVTVVQEFIYGPEPNPVVVVNIPKGDMRPYRTNEGRYYVRNTSGRRPASREELLRLFQAVESLYYDETPMQRLTEADLDLSALERYLERTGQTALDPDRSRLLTNWRLLAQGHPTLAGVVFFGAEPQRHLPYVQINAARFPGDDDSVEPADRKDLTGRLLDIIEQAERFLDLHLRRPHEIEGFRPEARPELPKEALREAIVNAVAHRDYVVRAPIRLFVLDDRIDIHTPGKLPNTVDEAAMRAGVHVVRNPHIYARLTDAGLVTGAGTGVRRLIRLSKETTGQDVRINVSEAEVLVSLPRRS